jgi:hypothetical protein
MNHEKGLPKNAGKKPLRVFYMPSEAFYMQMVVDLNQAAETI